MDSTVLAAEVAGVNDISKFLALFHSLSAALEPSQDDPRVRCRQVLARIGVDHVQHVAAA